MPNVRAKILQISDLHFGASISGDLKTKVHQIVSEVHPDLLVVTGDLVNHPLPWLMKRAAAFVDSLRQECAKPGRVMVVPGNHDYKFYGNVGLRRLTRVPYHVYFRGNGAPGNWRSRLRSYLGLTANALWPRGKKLRDLVQVEDLPELGITVFGFDSTPLAEMMAAGRVGDSSFQDLLEKDPALAGRFRLAIVHHHPAPIAFVATDMKHRIEESFMILYNAGTFLWTLCESQFHLVLHGHRHFAGFMRVGHDLKGQATEQLAVAAAGSALHPHPDDFRGNQLNLVELYDDGTAMLRSWFFAADVHKKKESSEDRIHSLTDAGRMRHARLRQKTGLTAFEQKRTVKITADGYSLIQELTFNCRVAAERGVSGLPIDIDVDKPCYVRGVQLLTPHGALPQQSLVPGKTALRKYLGSVDFGGTLLPDHAPWTCGYSWRLLNGHALTAAEFSRHYRHPGDPYTAWEYASAMCETSCDLLTLVVEFPDKYDLAALNMDVEVKYMPDPLEEITDYNAGKLQEHPEEAARVRDALELCGNVATLRCTHPIPGFLYRVRWSFKKEESAPKVSLQAQEWIETAKEQLLKAARGHLPDLYQRIRGNLEALARDVAKKLAPGAITPGEELDVSLMIFDHQDNLLKFVCETPGEIARLMEESFIPGEGCAGFAFEKVRPVLYHPATDTIGYYISRQERMEVEGATELTDKECLLSLPWIDESGIVVGAVTIGAPKKGSVLLKLFDMPARRQEETIGLLQALTGLALKAVLRVAAGTRMPPISDPTDAEAGGPYEVRQEHSEGMISFTYRKPAKEILEALKDTETYRLLAALEAEDLKAPEPE
jgi:hypothetical protein